MKPSTIVILSTLICASFFTSCNKKLEKSPQVIDKAAILLGNWEGKIEGGEMTESWIKRNDSVFEGTAMFIKGKDTLHFETSTLKQNMEDLIYSMKVVDQNNDLPISFRLTSADSTSLVFENPAHDFPKKIAYKFIGKDSVSITLSGAEVGKPSTETYGLKKK